ncbi:hypothetical protein HDU67_003741, partial [Dinochytrium kinnereticum]
MQQPTPSPSPAPTTPAPSSSTDTPRSKCKFFSTSKGCRSGSECRFQHIDASKPAIDKALPNSMGKRASKAKSVKPVEAKEASAGSAPTGKRVLTLQMVNGKMLAVESSASGSSASDMKKEDEDRKVKGKPSRPRGKKREKVNSKTAVSATRSDDALSTEASASTTARISKIAKDNHPPPSTRSKAKSISTPPVERPAVLKPTPKASPATRTSASHPAPLMYTDRGTTEVIALERRFRTDVKGAPNFKETQRTPTTVTFRFTITPSDPDFPFDLTELDVELTVQTSEDLPASQPPISGSILRVRNGNVPGHLARGIERAWERTTSAICSTSPNGPGSSLLAMANWLDRNLERLLGATETVGSITFVKNDGATGPVSSSPERWMPIVDTASLVSRDIARDDRGGFKSRVFYYGVPRDASEPDESESEIDEAISAASDFETISDSDYGSDVDGEESEEIDEPTAEPSSFLLHTPHKGIQLRLPDATLTSISILTCTSVSLQIRCLR